MEKYSADLIFTLNGDPLRDHVVITDDLGTILSIDQKSNHKDGDVRTVKGIITPGFINSHCHLELSHMKGLVDTGTGLLPFIESVVKYRDFPEEQIMDAIAIADQEMYDGGIVAVGDISNKTDTANTKRKSRIRYYTFVEMFDFMQDSMTDSVINQYQAVYNGQSDENGNRKSFVPHAPYTVSDDLYKFINGKNSSDCTVSIHNQETPHEDALFKDKKGGFLDFYKMFGFTLDNFQATGKSSIQYAMNHLDPSVRNLFVHNTMTTSEDIELAHNWSSGVYWATCANANLYIENRLPDYKAFIDSNARMTIGTDSLTSNWQLSILEEIKTIRKYKSYVPLETLFTWACKNGAEALGFDDQLGTIEVGKQPGLVHIDAVVSENDDVDISQATAQRL